CIPLPPAPDSVRIGRQTNAKTVPGRENGFFDSKVLSRQHAQDVKSSNGTFVNSQRLSNENQESEPRELKRDDTLELGIDILSEDSKTVIHHKVAARVEHAGFQPYPGLANGYNISLADIDPEPSQSEFASIAARRNSIQKSFNKGININIILKRLNDELRASRAVTLELQSTKGVFDELEGCISQKPPSKIKVMGNMSTDMSVSDTAVPDISVTQESESSDFVAALQKAREHIDLQSAQIVNLVQELQKEQEMRLLAEKRLASFLSCRESVMTSEHLDQVKSEVAVNELVVVSGDDTRLSRDVDRLQDLVREAHSFAKEWEDKARHAEAMSEQKLRELEELQREIELSSESSTASEEDGLCVDRRVKRGRRRRGYHGRIAHGKEPKEEGFTPFGSAFGVVLVGIGIFAIMNGYQSFGIFAQIYRWSRLK
ncbi:hypothetical protein NEOLI_004603, partial [Neolecta irregularis DAH-3]